jgi:hypothetical protein
MVAWLGGKTVSGTTIISQCFWVNSVKMYMRVHHTLRSQHIYICKNYWCWWWRTLKDVLNRDYIIFPSTLQITYALKSQHTLLDNNNETIRKYDVAVYIFLPWIRTFPLSLDWHLSFHTMRSKSPTWHNRKAISSCYSEWRQRCSYVRSQQFSHVCIVHVWQL